MMQHPRPEQTPPSSPVFHSPESPQSPTYYETSFESNAGYLTANGSESEGYDNGNGYDNGYDNSYDNDNDNESTPYKSFSNSLLQVITPPEEDSHHDSNTSDNHSQSSSSYNQQQHLISRKEAHTPPIDTIDTDTIRQSNLGSMSPLGAAGVSEDPNFSINASTYASNSNSSSRLHCHLDDSLNTAFVFIKPHANTEETAQLVRTKILDLINPLDDGQGCIVSEFNIKAETIRKNHLVYKQYKTLARYATEISGSTSSQSKIPQDQFNKIFGEELKTVIAENRIYNAVEAISNCACTPALLNELWVEAEQFESSSSHSMKKLAQFGNDYYCANLLIHDQNVYVINGFFMAMGESYIEKGTSIKAFVIQWYASESLNWCAFRRNVIGNTDPALAEEGSIRRLIYDKYEHLGIKSRPNLLDNAIHASISPLEAVAEQCSWLQCNVKSVQFGRLLLGRGVPESTILNWCNDFKVKTPKKTLGKNDDDFCYSSPFELVKDLDSAKECSNRLIGLYDYELFGNTKHQQAKCCRFFFS